MIRFTLSQLAAIAHGERQGSDVAIDEVTTDTRKVTAGCLFVALKGSVSTPMILPNRRKRRAPARCW
nr:UDP-N-acetylmuramoyl-tripeptide--D-alanyl-D-alanine ligase [Klebsiella pneumoniae]